MGIAAVFIYRDYWRIGTHQILTPESFQNPLLDFEFIRATFANPAANFLEGGGGNLIQRVAGGEGGFNLFFGQCCFEKSDQVSRADDVLPQPTYQLQRPAIDQRYRKNAV